MTFDEWYDSKESTQLIPPELSEFWREGVRMVWDAAVEETKKACVQAVGNVMMEPACHWSTIKNAIMQAEVK